MADAAPTTGQLVTVCCKLPHGLILELAELRKEAPLMGGGGEVDVYRPTGERVTITGSGGKHDKSPNPGRVVAGYGLTDISAEFWNKWAAQNKGFPPLAKGLLFAQATRDKAGSQAKEHAALKTGMEPLDADKPAPGITKRTDD